MYMQHDQHDHYHRQRAKSLGASPTDLFPPRHPGQSVGHKRRIHEQKKGGERGAMGGAMAFSPPPGGLDIFGMSMEY